jgi:hypothetical protein
VFLSGVVCIVVVAATTGYAGESVEAQAVQDALQVADGVGPAAAAERLRRRGGPGVEVSDDGRDVVVDKGGVEADAAPATADSGRIEVPPPRWHSAKVGTVPWRMAMWVSVLPAVAETSGA